MSDATVLTRYCFLLFVFISFLMYVFLSYVLSLICEAVLCLELVFAELGQAHYKQNLLLLLIKTEQNLREKLSSGSFKVQEQQSQCGCHLRLFIECVCVWSTKSSNHAGLLCCSKL